MHYTACTAVVRSSLTITFQVHYRLVQRLIPFVGHRPYANDDDDDVDRYYDVNHCWMSRIRIDLDRNDEGYPLNRPLHRYSVSSDGAAVADVAFVVAVADATVDFADAVEVAVESAVADVADVADVAAIVVAISDADVVAVTLDYRDAVMM